MAANPGPAEEFRQGRDKVLGFFVGQVMKETKGQANPQVVNELLRKHLGADNRPVENGRSVSLRTLPYLFGTYRSTSQRGCRHRARSKCAP